LLARCKIIAHDLGISDPPPIEKERPLPADKNSPSLIFFATSKPANASVATGRDILFLIVQE